MLLTTSVLVASPESHQTPLLAIAVTRGTLPPSLHALNRATDGALERVFASTDFSGKRDDLAVLYPPGPAKRIVLVGMGKAEEMSRQAVRRAAGAAAKRARILGVVSAAFHLPEECRGNLSGSDQGQAMAEGLAQGAWHYMELKQPPEEKRPVLEHFDILTSDAAQLNPGHTIGAAIAAGHVFARGLQILPGNQCTPTYLATRAEELAGAHGFSVTVLDRPAMEKEGMGALLAVAQGSAQEPRFIILEYKGAEGAPVVLVGKGVTFDTGGISIKPAPNMEDMKYDMSGAAAVLGTFEMLGRLKPKLHVVGLVPSAENMPSSTAYRPGDVVRALSGKTIEIINTDAEGRLLLCDALAYARRYAPACALDIATLTGAIVIALGHTAIGLMGTDDALTEEVRLAGERAGERGWPLPLWDDYRDLIKSDIADVKNSGGRPAGSISAGWFLREFVEGFPWVHLDIAGTAYTEREAPDMVKGPTGSGVRLFSEFILSRAQ
ncbi:MAG: leucyl aminopeptidase [Gemmatimonadota bacterium]